MYLIIEERAGASLLDDAEHGQFDICIANLPVDDKLFNYQLMMKEEVLLAVNTNTQLYKKLEDSAVRIDDRKYPAVDYKWLDGEAFVTLGETQPTQKSLNDICAKAGFSVKTAVECRTIETQFSMVRAGIGAALVPSGISPFINADKVEFFSFIQYIPYRDMAVLYRKGQYLSKAVKELIKIMTSLES